VPIGVLIGDLIVGTLQTLARKEAAPPLSWVTEFEQRDNGGVRGPPAE
jgi:hypothetical protein